MKRLFILLAAVLMTASMMAEGHMKFKGVEIDGTYGNFLERLHSNNANCSFAGISMRIFPLTTSRSNTVYSVVAASNMIDEMVSLNAQYAELKTLLTQKYGKGKTIVKYDGYYHDQPFGLKRGNACNALVFTTEQGKIFLYIHKSEYQTIHAGTLNIQYIDAANDQLRIQEANEDI